MPTSQLTHPLFQPDHLSRLTLQPFHPVRKLPALLYSHAPTLTPRVPLCLLRFTRKQSRLQSYLKH